MPLEYKLKRMKRKFFGSEILNYLIDFFSERMEILKNEITSKMKKKRYGHEIITVSTVFPRKISLIFSFFLFYTMGNNFN